MPEQYEIYSYIYIQYMNLNAELGCSHAVKVFFSIEGWTLRKMLRASGHSRRAENFRLSRGNKDHSGTVTEVATAHDEMMLSTLFSFVIVFCRLEYSTSIGEKRSLRVKTSTLCTSCVIEFPVCLLLFPLFSWFRPTTRRLVGGSILSQEWSAGALRRLGRRFCHTSSKACSSEENTFGVFWFECV